MSGDEHLRDSLVGRCLGDRYEIETIIGEGSMGLVYRARQLLVDRPVAVKVLPHQHNDEDVRRFLQEARAVSKLLHPNIVTVYDFHRTRDGILYLVMEYLEGKSLADALSKGPLAVGRSVSIAAQICAGLEEAHRHGVIHRDLKPENIMLTKIGGREIAKILDFGIAKSLGSGDSSAKKNLLGVSGTALYMSPEQVGKGPVVPASDLYALGVVLFEMLSGRPPFMEESVSMLMVAHFQQDPPKLREVAGDRVSPGLEVLVSQCLEKDAVMRPRSATALRHQLEEILDRLADDDPGLSLSVDSSASLNLPPVSISESSLLSQLNEVPLRPGLVVAQRYQIESTDKRGRSDICEAIDLGTADKLQVLLRRIVVPDEEMRDATELALERWFDLLKHLDHDALVPHMDHGWEGDSLLLVGRRPVGEPLSAVLERKGPFQVKEALELIEQLCQALELLHNLRLLHLDIRPANIRLVGGRPQLMNTALWALNDAKIELFSSEEVQLARRYKSPEQLGVLRGRIGPAADLYALGCTLLEMLTGTRAFEQQDNQALMSAKVKPLLPVRLDDLPRALDAVLERLLRPQAVDRYRSVVALRADIARILKRGERNALSIRRGVGQLEDEGRLHGRDFERTRLRVRIEALHNAGKGSMVLLVGPAGAGKSRLIEAAIYEMRRRGGLVLRTKATPHEVSSPFGALRALLLELGGHLAQWGPGERERYQAQIKEGVGELGGLLKGYASFLDTIFEGAPELPPMQDDDANKVRLMRALARLLLSIGRADRPLCIVLDDIQWMDDPTRIVLEYLAPTISLGPTLVLGGTRSVPEHHPVAKTLAALSEQEILELQPLSTDAVEAFLSERLGRAPGLPEFSEKTHQLSGGNPAAIQLLIQQSKQAGVLSKQRQEWKIALEKLGALSPVNSVVERMKSQLEKLPENISRPLSAAALWEGPINLRVLTRLARGWRRQELVSALVKSERAGILQPIHDRPGWFEFSHDALREAATALLPDGTKRTMHRRAADALKNDQSSEHLQRVAEHILRTDPRPEDVEWLARAAKASLQDFAASAAARLAKEALDRLAPKDPRVALALDLKLVMGRGLALAGRPDDARQWYEKILEAEPNLELSLEGLRQLGHTHFQTGRFEECIQSLDRALELLNYSLPQGRWRRLAMTLWRLASEVFFKAGQSAPAEESARESRWICALLTEKTFAMFFIRADGTILSLLEALHHGRVSGAPETYARSLCQAGGVAISGAGQVGIGERLIEAARDNAQAGKEPYARSYADTMQLLVHGVTGRFQWVNENRKKLRREVARFSEAWLEALYAAFVFEVLKEQGRIEEAAELAITQAGLLSQSQTREWSMVWARQFGAWVLTHCGRPDLALFAVDEALSTEKAKSDVVVRGYLLAQRVVADGGALDYAGVNKGAQIFLKHLEEVPPAKRHLATNLVDVARSISLAALANPENAEMRTTFKRTVRWCRRVLKHFPCYRSHLDLVNIRWALLAERPMLRRVYIRRALRRLRSAARQPSVIAAEIYEEVASLLGGMRAPLGRRLYQRAWEELRMTDDFHPTKQRLAELLKEQPADTQSARAITDRLVQSLSLPRLANAFETFGQSVTMEKGYEGISDLLRQVRLVRLGTVTLAEMLSTVVQFVYADLGVLCVRRPMSDRLDVVESAPRSTAVAELELCQEAINAGESIVRRLESGGRVAAVPDSSGALAVVLFLKGQDERMVFDDAQIRFLQVALSALATVIDLRESPSSI